MKELYIITGFLGAGKTTFINNAIEIFKNKKIAIIVNEFGKEGIDGKAISQKGYEVQEICNGSIFCTCRLDMFMEVLTQADKTDADVILVETSGLSDPNNIDFVLSKIKNLSDVEYNYRGCICIVDAKNFIKVLSTAVVITSQIKKASLIIVNKSDLLNESDKRTINEQIQELNRNCPVFYTSYSKVPYDIINNISPSFDKPFNNKIDIMSESVTFELSDNVTFEELEMLFANIKNYIYRCKGYAKIKDRIYFIDGTMENIKIDEDKNIKDIKNRIVILYNSKYPVLKKVNEFCEKYNCKIIN